MARVAILHAMLHLLALEMIEIEGSGARIMHEGHGGFDGWAEYSIIGVRDGSSVVQPGRHTHVALTW